MSYACRFLNNLWLFIWYCDTLVLYHFIQNLVLQTNLISEPNNLFLLQTVLACVEVLRPVVFRPSAPSELKREMQKIRFSCSKNLLPSVAIERIRSLRGATKTWQWQEVTFVPQQRPSKERVDNFDKWEIPFLFSHLSVRSSSLPPHGSHFTATGHLDN